MFLYFAPVLGKLNKIEMEKLQVLTVGECIAIARAKFEKTMAEQKLKEFGRDKIESYLYYSTQKS